MAKSSQRIKNSTLKEDDLSVLGLQSVVGYAPFTADITLEAILAAQAEMEQAQDLLIQMQKGVVTQRVRVIHLEHRYHKLVQRSKSHVWLQYGEDSAEVRLVGLKRVSEYDPPKRRTT